MKVLCAVILALTVTATQALAATNGANGEGMGLMAIFCIAFGCLIVFFQLIPGLMLFTGMTKGLFGTEVKETEHLS